MQSSYEHASGDDLERYSMGTLPAAGAETLEEHLLICAGCQDRLAETDTYVRAVRRAAAQFDRGETPASAGPFLVFLGAVTFPKLAWSVAAVVALAAILWFPGVWKAPRTAGIPPVTVVLQSFRGEAHAATVAPERRALWLQADVSSLAPAAGLDAQIVDSSGRRVAGQPVQPSGGRVSIHLPEGLGRGAYWVRLSEPGPAGEVLREYSLRVE